MIFVHHSSPHHAKNSGYGRLIHYMKGQVVYGKTKFPYPLAKFLASRHTQDAGIYNSDSVLKSIELYSLLKRHKEERNIVHFLNGERDVRHLGFFKKRFPNTFFCATFHKPPEVLKNTITNTSSLKKLDGAIGVGANQVEFLKEWLQLDKVEYIPHGVDTEFFKPNPDLKKKNTLLFVGQHLRDFEMFNATVPRLAEEIKDLKVNVVLHPAYVSKIVHHPNVEVFTKVDDKTLLRFYQEVSVLYLPMLDSTACNSLLEAMACGLPVISSKVGGNMTYMEGTGNILIEKGDAEKFVTEAFALLNDEKQVEQLGGLSRDQSFNYEWKKVSKKVEDFYRNLA